MPSGASRSRGRYCTKVRVGSGSCGTSWSCCGSSASRNPIRIPEVTGLSSSGSSRTAVRTWRSPSPTVKKAERLRRIASGCGAKTVLDLALTLQSSDGTFDSALFFEQLCVEGHNLHPGSKTKMLMEPEAVYRYAPEFDGTPDRRLVGIR